MMRAWRLLVLVIALLGSPAPARADDTGGPAPRGAVYAVAGLGTPVGFFGFEGVYRIVPSLELAAGAGLGFSTEGTADNDQLHVLQWAVMPRYRLGTDRNALTVGLGLSGGNYSHSYLSLCGSQEDEPNCNTPESWRYTLWANLEIGGEYWATSRFAFRYFAGYGHVLAQGAQHCEPSPSTCWVDASNLPYANIPYFGVALGGWY
jgi:hypothetical protein